MICYQTRFLEDLHNSKLPRGLEEVVRRYRDEMGLSVVTKNNTEDEINFKRPKVKLSKPKQSPRKLQPTTSETETSSSETAGISTVKAI